MKVGYVQTKPRFGDVNGNLERALALSDRVEGDLLVFPELFATGYQFTNRDELTRYAEPIPDGPTTSAMVDYAKRTGTFLAGGLAERDGERIYHSAVLVGPDGSVHTYRKTHLFYREKEMFGRTDEDYFRVFDIGSARVGMIICVDWIYPESARTLAIRGAQVIVHMTNLVLPYCQKATVTRCIENRVFTVLANRVGSEERWVDEPLTFTGESVIIDPKGEVLSRAPSVEESTDVVEIDPTEADDKNVTLYNSVIEDRRPELYDLG
ncbi:MAG: acyltransferase [bacterium]|nr:acyltransferase [bacterium]